jgi:hypothetical protein
MHDAHFSFEEGQKAFDLFKKKKDDCVRAVFKVP